VAIPVNNNCIDNKKVFQKAFLKILGLKRSSLRKKSINFLDDIELDYDNYLAKILRFTKKKKKFLELIPKSKNCKFYETFYCTQTIPISKSQNLLRKLFDEKNEKRKSNESKGRKTKSN
jgi:hypothetical protein